MIIVKVTYTTRAEYAEQNQNNIREVMADLQRINNPRINYNACMGPDGKSFIHTAFFKAEEDRKMLNDLVSFKSFQEQLKASGMESPPKQELLNLVGSSTEIFHS